LPENPRAPAGLDGWRRTPITRAEVEAEMVSTCRGSPTAPLLLEELRITCTLMGVTTLDEVRRGGLAYR
jgi:hypothetical protein